MESERRIDLVMTERYKASLEAIFDAWTKPEIAKKFLFTAPWSEKNDTQMDVRVGGRWTIMDRRDGVDYAAEGEYKVVERPHRLVFSFGMPMFSPDFEDVEIELKPEGDETVMTFRQKEMEPAYVEPTRDGYSHMFRTLGHIVEGRTLPLVVRVMREFKVPAERVFDAWLDPDMLRKWMSFDKMMWDLQKVEIDAREGGRFSIVDLRDGQLVNHTGEYLKIDRPHRLVFTWNVAPDEGGSTVALDIVPQEEGCLLTLYHEMDAQWAEYFARTEQGWTKLLGGLARALEG